MLLKSTVLVDWELITVKNFALCLEGKIKFEKIFHAHLVFASWLRGKIKRVNIEFQLRMSLQKKDIYAKISQSKVYSFTLPN